MHVSVRLQFQPAGGGNLNRAKAGPKLTATAVATTGVDPTTAQHSSSSSRSGSNKSWIRSSVARGALLPVRQVGANLLKARAHVSGSLWPPGQRFNWCRRCCSSPVGVNSWALKCYKIDQTADTKIQKLRYARKSLPVRSAFYSLCTQQHTNTPAHTQTPSALLWFIIFGVSHKKHQS